VTAPTIYMNNREITEDGVPWEERGNKNWGQTEAKTGRTKGIRAKNWPPAKPEKTPRKGKKKPSKRADHGDLTQPRAGHKETERKRFRVKRLREEQTRAAEKTKPTSGSNAGLRDDTQEPRCAGNPHKSAPPGSRAENDNNFVEEKGTAAAKGG